jgi:hypothetical protein
MSRVYLLVEGQTEEAFVRELMMPHYAQMGLYLTPIIVRTSQSYRGGVVSYAKIRPQIQRLCKQDVDAFVTLMLDLYALPEDFPGKTAAYQVSRTGQERADFVESALAKDIGHRNFIPNLLVHEFEALLFTRIDAFELWTDDDDALEPLRQIRSKVQPEDINDNAATAPSKRILAAMPNYQKTVHGPLIACHIGLDAIRNTCPHFDEWLKKIERLAK